MRQRRRTGAFVLLAAIVAGGPALAGCGSGPGSGGAPQAVGSGRPRGVPVDGKIGVILPDVESSTRWEQADRPALEAAFQQAGVDYQVENAKGDPAAFLRIADTMLDGGAGVLMIASLDSDSGAEVIRRAASAGVPVIDYDRLTLGGGAKYYVSFDNVAVGKAIGTGLVKNLRAAGKRTGNIVELNGSPTDNNATQFRQGYDQVLKAAGYTVVDQRAVPGWNDKLAVGLFREMLTKAGGKIDGVASANDGLGGAAVSVLADQGLAGKVPVTGQDATDEGLQRVLLGTQAMTVYKAIKLEAESAARLAIAIIRGDNAAADTQASGSVDHAPTGTHVRAVLLQPKAIEAASVKDVVADGFTTAARLCTTAELKAACAANGVS